MSRVPVFFSTFVILVLARVSDLLTTFWFDPSLTFEGNPIILLFGGGVISLVTLVLAVLVLVISGLVVFWLGPSLAVTVTPFTFVGFVRLWLNQVAINRQPFRAYLRGGSHRNEGLQAIRLFSVGLAWALIFGSFAAVYAWSAIWLGHSAAYKSAFSYFSVGRFSFMPAITALLGFLFGAALFFRSEYSAIKKLTSENDDSLAL